MKFFRHIATCLLLLFCLANPANAEFKKTKVAVLDFQLQGQGFETGDMGKIVAEWLITAFVKDGRFDVIERNLLEKILNEQKLSTSGLIDANSASKIGRILGAKAIISGSVIRIQNTIEVNARIINVQDGSIVAAESVSSSGNGRLHPLVVRMADKIIMDFPLEGYIVKKSGKNVVIDLGRLAGVRSGMEFTVFSEGSIIKHPRTGEILDIERIETGVVRVTDVKDKTASADIVKESSTNAISYGQMVRIMSAPASPTPIETGSSASGEGTVSAAAPVKQIAGLYNARGTNPNGSTYSGVVTISQQNGLYNFIWKIANATYAGSGSFQGDELVINWGQAHPVIYRLDSANRLVGTWNNGNATEVLTPVR